MPSIGAQSHTPEFYTSCEEFAFFTGVLGMSLHQAARRLGVGADCARNYRDVLAENPGIVGELVAIYPGSALARRYPQPDPVAA
jgi:hypothetical protein